jgi:2-hydroxychromene-2-carboxylate isomerase
LPRALAVATLVYRTIEFRPAARPRGGREKAAAQSEPIDFCFSIGSIHTYLAVMRIAGVEEASGVRFRFRPFSVRAIMIEMDNIPAKKPVKMGYLWRDTERRAAMYGVRFAGRPPYPLDLANRVAVLGAREGWCASYVRATYRRWFVDQQEAGAEPNLSDSLKEIGEDAGRVIAFAQTDEIGRAYEMATDEARKLQIFGAPSFVARGELFWGNDCLEDAVRWHQAGTLAQVASNGRPT